MGSLCAIAVVASVGVPITANATSGTDNSTDRALDAAIRNLSARKNGPPGVAVMVQRGDDIRLHAGGTSDLDSSAPIQADDHMRMASVAKAFSGAAALAEVAGGAIALDDTIGARLPDLPAAWSAVTLRDLLHHTSGIPDFSKAPAFQDAVRASLTVAPPPADLLNYVENDPLEFRPGERYRYSNSDNIVVGLMLEAVTGQPYDVVLEARVSLALGLGNTSLPAGAEMPTPYIHGYALDLPDPPDDVSELIAAGWSWASGGVISTPSDANRFVRGYVTGGTTDAASRAQQLEFIPGKSEPPGPGQNAAGLAIFRYKTKCGTVYGHTGNTAGYTQFIAATRDGTRSATVGVSAQIVPKTSPKVFPELRRLFGLAVCAALDGS